jgi:tripartite-type tricarboxylate transporter receptor subunit TctC
MRKLIVAMATLAGLGPALAQTAYPDHPVQMVLGWSPGAAVDLMARAVAEEMSNRLGQRFVILNKEGGAGTIGFSTVTNAQPDGYTLAVGPSHSINVAGFMMKKKLFDVDSLDYVCRTFMNDFTVTVSEDSPIKSIPDLVTALKADPGKLTYGHLGPASIPHLAMVELLQQIGAEAVGIPFRGDAQVIPAVMSGNIDIGVSSLLSVVPQAGKIRVLAVFGDKRHPTYPELPSLAERGITISPNRGMNGIFAPKGTPAPVLKALQEGCAAALRSEPVQAVARRVHSGADYQDSAAFEAAIRDDYRRKGELIRRLNLEPN